MISLELVLLVVGLLIFSVLLLYIGISNIIGKMLQVSEAVANRQSLNINFSFDIKILVSGLLFLGLTLVLLAGI